MSKSLGNKTFVILNDIRVTCRTKAVQYVQHSELKNWPPFISWAWVWIKLNLMELATPIFYPQCILGNEVFFKPAPQKMINMIKYDKYNKIHTYIYTHTYIIYIYIYIYTHTHIYIYTYTHIYIYTNFNILHSNSNWDSAACLLPQ